MNQFKIFVLNKLSQTDGVYTVYISIDAFMAFLRRTNINPNRLSILLVKGNRTQFINNIDASTIQRNLHEFMIAK